MFRLSRSLGGLLFAVAILGSCIAPEVSQSPQHSDGTQNAPHDRETARQILLDFERPDPPVEWISAPFEIMPPPAPSAPPKTPAAAPTPGAAVTPPSTPPAAAHASLGIVARIAREPQAGLWDLEARVGGYGALLHRFKQPADLRSWNTLEIHALQNSEPSQSGRVTAAAFLIDGTGRKVVGDAYPLRTRWQAIPLDLAEAAAAGAALEGVQAVGVEFRGEDSGVRNVETDTWAVRRDVERYVGQRLGLPKSFYAEGQGLRLRIGQVGRWELTFHQRGIGSQAWLNVIQGKDRQVLGQPGTGLMLLDQDELDGLGDAVTQTATGGGRSGRAPRWAWPGGRSTWEWRCAWASANAALVEVRQVSGPYDRLGRPAVAATWRFTVYQTGQVFVCVEWGREGEGVVPELVTLALALDKAVCAAPAAAEPDALLRAIYPRPFREGVLPHQMQAGNPVMMLAKAPADEQKLWWRAEAGDRRFFGCGLSAAMRQGPVACTLLVNSPTPLDAVSAFSGYLRPATVEFKSGVLDSKFPGDIDNDGLAEPYGFQAIRLQNGRASFVLNPDNRPIFYPVFLITLPAEDRERMDLAKRTLLVNVDGHQIGDLPRWPDGSFVLQLPWIINKTVRVEAELVGK